MGNVRPYCLLFLLLFCGQSLAAQINKTWFSAEDKTLKGKVKTWTMRYGKAIVRQQQYDSSGQLLSDTYTYKGTPQTYIPPEMLPAQYKKQHEKKYNTALSRIETGFETSYNNQNQLIEKKRYVPIVDSLGRATSDSELVYRLTNRFNKAGQIVSSHG